MPLTPTDLTPTADPAVFTVPEDYVAGTLGVLVDGVYQEPTTVYSVGGVGNRDVTFLVAPSGWVAGTWEGVVTAAAATHYLTAAMLQARVGGNARYLLLTDDDADSIPDTAVEDYLLSQVDIMVDAFARRAGYTTPLASGDVETILPFLLDIANYKAQTRAGGASSDDDKKLYNDAMSILHQIGTSSFKLPSYQTAAPIADFGFDSEQDADRDGPVFSRSQLRDF